MAERGTFPESRRVAVDGCELAVAVAGSGPPVVLVHGLTANRTIWLEVVRRLESSFRLILPDLCGRGESAPPTRGGYGLEAERVRLAKLVAVLGIRRPLVVGHSHGAALSLALAAEGPPLRGLVLLNPVTPWTARPKMLSMLRLPGVGRVAGALVPVVRGPATRWLLRRRVFTGTAEVPADAVARFAEPYGDPSRARALPRVLADWNPASLARYFPPPTAPPGRVLAGARDARIRPGHAARLAAGLGAPLRLLTGVGHAIPMERPGAVAEAVGTLASDRR